MDYEYDWINEYYNWLKSNTQVQQLKSGWTEIGTPFMDRHNDGLTIYAKLDGDTITLSDDGYIIADLAMDGFQFSGKKRRDLLHSTLSSYGIQNVDNELTMVTSREKYPADLHLFIQALIAVNDMFVLSKPNAKNIFYEDVASYLDAEQIIYTPSFIAKGSTGLEFNFNFHVAGRTSEILINTFNNLNQQMLSAFLFNWQDIRDERQKQSKKKVSGLAIINDLEKSVDSKYLKALSHKGTEYILFSEKNQPDNIKKLHAA